MENFKGTKGKWKLVENDYCHFTSVRNLDDTRKIVVSRVNNQTESNANMLLISKSPEMLFELNETLKDLLVLQGNVLESAKIDKKWDGMYELIQTWIDRKKQLIKEATESIFI